MNPFITKIITRWTIMFGNLNRQINFLTNYWKSFLLNTKTNTWNSWFYGYAPPLKYFWFGYNRLKAAPVQRNLFHTIMRMIVYNIYVQKCNLHSDIWRRNKIAQWESGYMCMMIKQTYFMNGLQFKIHVPGTLYDLKLIGLF